MRAQDDIYCSQQPASIEDASRLYVTGVPLQIRGGRQLCFPTLSDSPDDNTAHSHRSALSALSVLRKYTSNVAEALSVVIPSRRDGWNGFT